MLVKGYKALWAAFILAAVTTAILSPTWMAFTVFGFIAFGMIFLGMLIVMPFSLLHENAHAAPAPVLTQSVAPQAAAGLDVQWLNNGVPAR